MDEIFVAATIDGGSASDMDFGLLKYDSSGMLLMARTWNGSANGVDIPADLKIDDNGNIYLVGGSEQTNSLSDYAIIKYDSTGLFQWHTGYDFADFHDAATSLTIDNTLVVTGASANSPSDWDYATLQIDMVTGNQINVVRTSVPGVGFDNALDVTSKNNNFYITGYVQVGGIKSIQTIKIDGNFGLVWNQVFDEGMNDEGNSVAVDDNGNIYVTGYSENGNGIGKDFITIKYDSMGNELWHQRYGSGGNPTEARGKQVVTLSDGGIIVAGTIEENGNKDFATIKYNENGDIEFEEIFDNNGDETVESIIDDGEDIYVTGISNNGISSIITTVKYSYEFFPTVIVLDSLGVEYVKDELLIRFDEKSVYHSIINNTEIEYGLLKDFIKPSVLSLMEQETGVAWDNFKTSKIFLRMTVRDSISISRNGDSIRMDDFWATLSVYIPDQYNAQELEDDLDNIHYDIHYAEKDYIGYLYGAPNDPNYSTGQSGLGNGVNGIDVESAWNRQTGKTHTKVGVFDTGINWDHEDFGNGTQAGTKVIGGWDFRRPGGGSVFRTTSHDNVGHGSAVAGIIGALRNNSKGGAGVAGGNVQSGNTGAQLFSFKVVTAGGPLKIKFIAPAIVEASAYSSFTFGGKTYTYGYGLDIQNHSWGKNISTFPTGPFSKKNGLKNLEKAVKSCFYNGCAFVAASGNVNQCNNDPTCEEYPASFADKYVVRVGGSDATGNLWYNSVYGNNQGNRVDVVAPATGGQYVTTDHNNDNTYAYSGNGTSFSAPHVAGVMALMHSEHNVSNSLQNYPNNLAPEDYEVFLQSFARDIGTPGYDLPTGSGIVDADESLWRISMPKYQVYHVKNPTSYSYSKIQSNATVILTNEAWNIPAGSYRGDKYQITQTFNMTFNTNFTILNYWKLISMARGISSAVSNDGQSHYDITSVSFSGNTISMTTRTYAWYLWKTTPLWLKNVNKWYPAHPSKMKTPFSVYLTDNNFSSIEEEEDKITSFQIFPNPASSELNLKFDNEIKEDATIELVDGLGKILYKKIMNSSSNHTIDISNLSQGVYFCKFVMGDKILTKKFIKTE